MQVSNHYAIFAWNFFRNWSVMYWARLILAGVRVYVVWGQPHEGASPILAGDILSKVLALPG